MTEFMKGMGSSNYLSPFKTFFSQSTLRFLDSLMCCKRLLRSWSFWCFPLRGELLKREDSWIRISAVFKWKGDLSRSITESYLCCGSRTILISRFFLFTHQCFISKFTSPSCFNVWFFWYSDYYVIFFNIILGSFSKSRVMNLSSGWIYSARYRHTCLKKPSGSFSIIYFGSTAYRHLAG